MAGLELRTPLATLLMQLQGVQRTLRKDPTAKVEERLAKAERSGLRLEKLINQLLDISRIAAGRLSLEPEAFNLADLVKEVVARFSEASLMANSPITIQPEMALNGVWDRERIDQVITNLISNAVKYGRGKPIEVELSSEAGYALVRVIDHGIGIDVANQQKIFQRFERAVASREFGGIGLGLWITRQIVDATGGTIEVKSAPGAGATFSVRLPLTPRDGAHAA
jgi:signal transduction histidine kinase